jgi:transcriptional regulator with XRE-family HTH domain
MSPGVSPRERLKAWRAERDISQATAGEKIGVSGPTWHEWESGGRTPKGGYRAALEILTGIPATLWMLDGEREAIEKAEIERAKEEHAAPESPEAA